LPAIALLGFALPVGFLSLIDPYLYYLRPLEMVPTYATAWLLLAVAAVPPCLLLGSVLRMLEDRPRWWLGHDALTFVGYTAGAVSVLAALGYGLFVWLQGFGLLGAFHPAAPLASASLAAALLTALLPAGRDGLMKLYSFMKYSAAVGSLSLLALPFAGWGTQPTETGASVGTFAMPHHRPHVLLVTVDTLSAEHMSLYGARRNTTPELEDFAHAATVFDHAYANANFTTAGVASIVTATRPWSHRALQLPAWPLEPARRSSLPALLHQAGYRMAALSSNPWAGAARNGLGGYFELATGNRMPDFNPCRDDLSSALRFECAASELPAVLFAGNLLERLREVVFDAGANRHFDPRAIIEPALAWLARADRSKPIFLWVHFYPPHDPYAAPEPWLGQFDSSSAARTAAQAHTEIAYLLGGVAPERKRTLEARYDESVRYVDHYVGDFLRRAQALLGDDTAVIVTADHGESFEHDYGSHGGPGLFDSLVHIPLLIKLPNQTRGARISVLAEQVDIAPTIAELIGMPAPQSWEGQSLLGASLDPDDPPAPKPVFTMNFEENPRYGALRTGSIAVIEGRWKLVHYMGALHYPKMPELHDALYDLSADPGELTNRMAEEPDQARHLLKLVTTELAKHSGPVR
jgi:arylsulfatase A-like enzyme